MTHPTTPDKKCLCLNINVPPETQCLVHPTPQNTSPGYKGHTASGHSAHFSHEQKPDPSPEKERFWSKVDKSDGCWEWNAYRNEKGYGQALFPGIKTRRAHRVAWILTNGPIEDGMVVCHKCDNPPCVRPEHLFLATQKENMEDCVQKGRICEGDDKWARKNIDKVPRAADGTHKLTKFSSETLLKAILEHREGVTYKEIREKYGISDGCIKGVLMGRIRKEVKAALDALDSNI